MRFTNTFFKHRLSRKALHIDYLRLRCGRERSFSDRIKNDHTVRACIAFSEWDVVLFAPTEELYPENLVQIYSNPDLTDAIAGSAGYFSYVWKHDVNHGWEGRLVPAGAASRDHVLLLVSLRFTDVFRAQYGIGAELLFCDFIERTLAKLPGITAVIAHGLGWNDATVILKAEENAESGLVDALTRIRYCRESECINRPRGRGDALVVAATYSHLLGDLELYVAKELSFGTLSGRVDRARILVRVNPSFEKGLRATLAKTFKAHGIDGHVGTELGHYNFSADLSEAFEKAKGAKRAYPVEIIQGFRDRLKTFMRLHKLDTTSFFETTTEITLKEDLSQEKDLPPVSRRERHDLRNVLEKINKIKDHASKMTRHRLALLVGTIDSYEEDAVRGSVVGYLSRFLREKFAGIIEGSDRAGQEDLCHILEYALHQVTDGLSQFQHDANSLGLSGRGGYSRLIQAVEQYVNELIGAFEIDIMPLLTFGLQPSHEGRTFDYWIDVPFTTAFNPPRWHVIYHEIAHMCWAQIFAERLEAFEVWKESSSSVITVRSIRSNREQKEWILAESIVEEVFPNYLMLQAVTIGSLQQLDRLMITREVISRPRSILIRTLLVRMTLFVLLDLHRQRHPKLPPATIERYRGVIEREGNEEECVKFAVTWWRTWEKLHKGFRAKDGKLRKAMLASTEDAATSLRDAIFAFEEQKGFKREVEFHGADNIAALVADPIFKKDAQDAVVRVVHILALRGADYRARGKELFEDGYDTFAAHLGYILVKLDAMRATAEAAADPTVGVWMPGFADAIDAGWVLTDSPAGGSLASMLSSNRLTYGDPKKPGEKVVLRRNLSAVLSLWHVAVTERGAVEMKFRDRLGVERRLQKLKLSQQLTFPTAQPLDDIEEQPLTPPSPAPRPRRRVRRS